MEMGIPFPCTSLVVLRGYRPAESGGFLGHTETVLWTVEGERICSGRLFHMCTIKKHPPIFMNNPVEYQPILVILVYKTLKKFKYLQNRSRHLKGQF